MFKEINDKIAMVTKKDFDKLLKLKVLQKVVKSIEKNNKQNYVGAPCKRASEFQRV